MLSTRELFNQHDLRCTRQRVLIYETLRECRCHPTAEELHRFVVDRASDRLSLATVYNTLDALATAGLIQRLPTENGCARFDADTRPHAHLTMRDTGEIVDVPHELGNELLSYVPAELVDRIEARLGVRIDGMSFQLEGRRDIGDLHC